MSSSSIAGNEAFLTSLFSANCRPVSSSSLTQMQPLKSGLPRVGSLTSLLPTRRLPQPASDRGLGPHGSSAPTAPHPAPRGCLFLPCFLPGCHLPRASGDHPSRWVFPHRSPSLCNGAVTYLSSKRCSAPPLPPPLTGMGTPCRRDPLWFPSFKAGALARTAEVCPVSPIPQLCSHVTLSERMSPPTPPTHPPAASVISEGLKAPRGRGSWWPSDLWGRRGGARGARSLALASLPQTRRERHGQGEAPLRDPGDPQPRARGGSHPRDNAGRGRSGRADNGPRPPGAASGLSQPRREGGGTGEAGAARGHTSRAREGLGSTRARSLPWPPRLRRPRRWVPPGPVPQVADKGSGGF